MELPSNPGVNVEATLPTREINHLVSADNVWSSFQDRTAAYGHLAGSGRDEGGAARRGR